MKYLLLIYGEEAAMEAGNGGHDTRRADRPD